MATHVAGPGRAGYEVSVVSPRRRVTVSGGAALAVSALREVDVLVVPGFALVPGLDVDAKLAFLAPEVAAIRSHAAAGNAVVSICVGAFLLAEAGLLHGRRATTAWPFAEELAHRCPGADVRPERLVVTDTGVTTTAAFSAMYDFALELIREHSGAGVARTTARMALVDDARSSQTPYVDARLLPRPGNEFSRRVMRQLDQNLAARYTSPRWPTPSKSAHGRCCGASRTRPARVRSVTCGPPACVAPATFLKRRTEPSPASPPRSAIGTPAPSQASSRSTPDNAQGTTARPSGVARSRA
jgi:transcriptional regulator GlxA family with amidase domain